MMDTPTLVTTERKPPMRMAMFIFLALAFTSELSAQNGTSRLELGGIAAAFTLTSDEPRESASSNPAPPSRKMSSFRSGLYGRLSASFTILFDGDLDREEGGTLTPGDAEYDTGVGYSGSLGYRWDNGFALELEGIYRRNELDSLEVNGVNIADEGDFASLTVYLNALYHFETGNRWRPYVGLGLGWVEEIDVDIDDGGAELGYDDSGFGYQAMVGVEYESDFGVGYFVEGRLFGATGFDLESEDGTGVEYDGNYLGLGLTLGLTYRF